MLHCQFKPLKSNVVKILTTFSISPIGYVFVFEIADNTNSYDENLNNIMNI